MLKIQESFLKVGQVMDIDVHVDHPITLSSGRQIVSLVYLPYFGGCNGTIIYISLDKLHDEEAEIISNGYSFSFLSDVEGYEKDGGPIEMFSEWGWYGPADKKPNWYIDSGAWNNPDEGES